MRITENSAKMLMGRLRVIKLTDHHQLTQDRYSIYFRAYRSTKFSTICTTDSTILFEMAAQVAIKSREVRKVLQILCQYRRRDSLMESKFLYQ